MNKNPLSDTDLIEIVENLRTSIACKRTAGLHFLDNEAWDLFVIGFKEGHCAGHGLLDLIDSRHRDHDPARNVRLGKPVRRIFEDLDAAIGDLVVRAGPDAEVAIFSTTCMAPNGSLRHLMSGIVEKIEAYLRACHGPLPSQTGSKLPGRYCKSVPYNENCSALRVRRIGVNTVPPRYRQLLDEIESLLGELTDIDNGEPVIESFSRPFSQLEGVRARRLPDLLARCRANAFPRGVSSERLGRIEATVRRLRPGNHAGGGLLVASGFRSMQAAHDVATPADIAGLVGKVLGVLPASVGRQHATS